MKSYSFYELSNSDLIENLRNMDKGHQYYNDEKWEKYKHYILTLHDNILECVSREFEIIEENTSVYNQLTTMLTG